MDNVAIRFFIIEELRSKYHFDEQAQRYTNKSSWSIVQMGDSKLLQGKLRFEYVPDNFWTGL